MNYFARCFNHLEDWVGASCLNHVSQSALADWNPVGSGHSFYLTNSNDYLDFYNKTIVAYMTCIGKEAWINSIGLMFFNKEDVDRIKPPTQTGNVPFGLIHYNMAEDDRIIRAALEELSFNNRKSSHTYSSEEISSRLARFSLNDWIVVFSNRGKDVAKKKVQSLINAFFRKNSPIPIPDSLNAYLDYLKQ